MAHSSKNIQKKKKKKKKKKKNAPGRTRKKIQILLYRFLDEYT